MRRKQRRKSRSVGLAARRSFHFSGKLRLMVVSFLNFSDSLEVPYAAGASYTIATVTSVGTTSLTFTAPGGITIVPDGSQVSWTHDGEAESVVMHSPDGRTVLFSTGIGNQRSPFSIPAGVYGAGSGRYSVTV